jgi:hypothetical protein
MSRILRIGARVSNGFKYSDTIGDGSTTTFPINHGLNTEDISVVIKNTNTGAIENADIIINGIDNITLIFTSAPNLNEYRVTIIS